MTVKSRLDRLRQAIVREKLDAMLVSSPENRQYLSGFTGSSGYLLISETEAVLATDFRYIEQAEQQALGYRVERISGNPNWIQKLASQLEIKRVGFEDQHMTVGTHTEFQKAISEAGQTSNLVMTEVYELVDKMRAIKDPEEMKFLSRAVELTDIALEEVTSSIRPGVTEKEVAWELEKSMKEHGADALAFDIIVGTGQNGALPHHHADGTAIGNGQSVVIDMGAKYHGYCADLSRTMIVGEPGETLRLMYQTVLRAQLEAENVVQAGMTGSEVDAIARNIIADAGYEKYFGHSLGHGVGLAVHEYPRLGPNADDVLENGMVFTIEPGIYLPALGGVRIEDIVVLENGRARVLSQSPKLSVS